MRAPWYSTDMTSKTSHLFLVVGLLLIGATSLLPIDATVVRGHTVEKLIRDGIKSFHEKDATEPIAVKLVIQTDGEDRAHLRGPVLAPSLKTRDAEGKVIRVPAFQTKGTSVLALTARQDGTSVQVQGSLGEKSFKKSARIGDWLALLPPLVALLLSIAYRRVILALLMAVLAGATVMHGGNVLAMLWVELKGLAGAVPALFGLDWIPVDGYFGQVLSSTFNLKILAFTFALVGMIAVIGRMGGTRGLVDLMAPLARGPRSAQVVTSLMGMAIFFDDYANTVVVGTTGRSLTDARGLSREKLAYVVDSTSAPVAGIALISTWIGYEVGLFEDLLGTLSMVPDMPGSGYEMFFEILPLRFYCFFALALVFLGAILSRDLGPMYTAERRVRVGGPVSPEGGDEVVEAIEKPGVRALARNAVIPIGLVLGLTLGWILWVGTEDMASFSFFSLADWKLVMDAASDSITTILLVSSLAGGVLAIILAISQRLLTVGEALSAYWRGIHEIIGAAAILILAWAIKEVCSNLGTGMAMVALVGDSVPGVVLPLTVFVLSGAVAFATGTSWGTMALVLPVAAPLAATISGEPLIVLACLGAVLDGAIWGDHCSPISDTTVLSSTACGCPHLSHVRTQLPYAFLAMGAAGFVGYLGVAVGLPIVVSYPIGIGVMAVGLLVFGKNPNVAIS